jgi:hypothetical protein
LTLTLVNERKLVLDLHTLFKIFINTAKKERDEISTAWVGTVRKVEDAPFMASYNERPRSDALAVGHLLHRARVAIDHKHVVRSVHADVDGSRGAVTSVCDDGHAIER